MCAAVQEDGGVTVVDNEDNGSMAPCIASDTERPGGLRGIVCKWRHIASIISRFLPKAYAPGRLLPLRFFDWVALVEG